jgi:hypothetical protein
LRKEGGAIEEILVLRKFLRRDTRNLLSAQQKGERLS